MSNGRGGVISRKIHYLSLCDNQLYRAPHKPLPPSRLSSSSSSPSCFIFSCQRSLIYYPEFPHTISLKVHFYKTAISFHLGPRTVNPICESVIHGQMNMPKCQYAVLLTRALVHIIARWSPLLDTGVPTLSIKNSCCVTGRHERRWNGR